SDFGCHVTAGDSDLRDGCRPVTRIAGKARHQTGPGSLPAVGSMVTLGHRPSVTIHSGERTVGDTYLVAYDIADPKRLRKVAQTSEDFGLRRHAARRQYPVFFCRLSATDLVRLTLAHQVSPSVPPCH